MLYFIWYHILQNMIPNKEHRGEIGTDDFSVCPVYSVVFQNCPTEEFLGFHVPFVAGSLEGLENSRPYLRNSKTPVAKASSVLPKRAPRTAPVACPPRRWGGTRFIASAPLPAAKASSVLRPKRTPRTEPLPVQRGEKTRPREGKLNRFALEWLNGQDTEKRGRSG